LSSPDLHKTDRFAAIVLAAGMSRRMGRHKPLLQIGDRSMIAHVVDGIVHAGISKVFIITGFEASSVRGALDQYPVEFIHNDDYLAGGMLSSVQLGVRAARSNCDAYFISLGDQPFIRPESFREMQAAFTKSHAAILLPTFNGKHGHPILVASRMADEILSLASDQTLNDLTRENADQTLEISVDDPAVVEDIDTPEDYARAVARKGELCPNPIPIAE
jgi:CTP:molybdopterin cytidylyltransferase MocA